MVQECLDIPGMATINSDIQTKENKKQNLYNLH